MSRFAEGTTVPAEKTRAEIESTLRRFGADAFSSGFDAGLAFIAFRARDRFIRIVIELPDRREFAQSPTGKPRTDNAAREAYEAECRRRWRSVGLLVKAKVAAVQDGIAEFESEFLANVVMPDGRTVAELTRPGIASAYETGNVPRLLPGLGDDR